MAKTVCSFCSVTREAAPKETLFVESRDKKSYICTECLAQAQAAVAYRLIQQGFKLKLV